MVGRRRVSRRVVEAHRSLWLATARKENRRFSWQGRGVKTRFTANAKGKPRAAAHGFNLGKGLETA